MESFVRAHATALLVMTVGLFAAALSSRPADAHPHVWVTMKTELVYTSDGTMSGVRHAWTFDDMFSAFATQGIEQKTKGEFSREELAPLAEVNVTSLKEYDFFTYAKADGKKAEFLDPVDYWLDYDKATQVLTLHFTLPAKAPIKAKALNLDIYDPSYFVDFGFAKERPVALANAPAACKATFSRPEDNSAAAQKLGEAFFNQLTSDYGAQFANKILVTCP